MSYERMSSIFYGVEVNTHSLNVDCFRFIEMKPNSELRKATADYFEKSIEEVNGDDLYDFLHDREYVIDCEFLDNMYIGDTYLTIGNYDSCHSFELEHLTKCASLTLGIKEFISTLYPDKKVKFWLINWIL